MERDHGALLRRADTTTHATAPISASRNGLFVRMAQMARQAAHNHHATRVQGAAPGDGGPRHSSAGLPAPSDEREPAQRRRPPPRSGSTGSRSLEEPPRSSRAPLRWRRQCGAHRMIRGCACCPRSTRSTTEVVVVVPDAAAVVVLVVVVVPGR